MYAESLNIEDVVLINTTKALQILLWGAHHLKAYSGFIYSRPYGLLRILFSNIVRNKCLTDTHKHF